MDRIEHRNGVRAQFRRAVEQAVGVDGGLALVGRDEVVQVVFRIEPIAHRDDEAALDPDRPRR